MRIIITGGGTGGHLYPALAIGHEFAKLGAEVRYIGSCNGIEKDVMKKEVFVSDFLPVEGIRNKNLFSMPKALFNLARSYKMAKKLVRDFAPDLIIGTGGYASFPVIKAGIGLGCKTMIHEANAEIGKANANLGARVDCLCLTYKTTAEQIQSCKNIKITGMPVRDSVKTTDPIAGTEYIGVDDDTLVVTITGGSQGSHHINEAMAAYYRQMPTDRNILFYHIVGKINGADAELVKGLKNVRVKEYEEKMDLVLSRTDIIVSRAGSSSLAEISIKGIPGILVPYPFSHGHQEKNAAYYHNSGGAIMVLDKDLPQGLFEALDTVIENADKRNTMSKAMAAEAKPEALAKIVEVGLALIKEDQKESEK
ncbi:MAG: UDP-N-acetylglucosamine--N-acetylmuramyl-(pentapeptide) pyrophosphoryl-undecaprenol N-acetylglucosamine transferase [Bacillota bacterium]|nr:UDP-N-acetylglucosamine--N-acetylmuramyl-(pentapeptide) pyrophosphoryl-undecaprenol N-acetylglucosamine transferase [Bacillota bacterium]